MPVPLKFTLARKVPLLLTEKALLFPVIVRVTLLFPKLGAVPVLPPSDSLKLPCSVMVIGLGAVATTMIAGVEAVGRGLA